MEPDLRHLLRMTDDKGMLQFARGASPDPASGYTADDNARALMVAVNLHNEEGDRLALGYLQLLSKLQQKDGSWCNLLAATGRLMRWNDSEDAQGRTFLACALAAADGRKEVGTSALAMITKALPSLNRLTKPRPLAYLLIGCCRLLRSRRAEPYAKILGQIEEQCCKRLVGLYQETSGAGWHWFEEQFTYCNGILPQALLAAADYKNDRRAREVASASLQFMGEQLTASGYLSLVGNRGWWQRGGKIPLYDQQPVDACSIALAALEGYHTTGEVWYRELMKTADDWFKGRNINGLPLYDQVSGGCCDGLIPEGLNRNQGAESTLSLLLTRQAVERMGD